MVRVFNNCFSDKWAGKDRFGLACLSLCVLPLARPVSSVLTGGTTVKSHRWEGTIEHAHDVSALAPTHWLIDHHCSLLLFQGGDQVPEKPPL